MSDNTNENVASRVEDDTLFLEVFGTITSDSVKDYEDRIMKIVEEYPVGACVLDAEGLKYISSAGLRMVLRLKKKKTNFKVINANSEVYDIFSVTGFSQIMTVEKAFRKIDVEGFDVVGRGAKAAIYRLNQDTMVKVYSDPDSLATIKRERDLAQYAFVHGVPTAIPYDVVLIGDRYGSIFELLNAKSFSELIIENPGELERYASEFALMLRTIHQTEVEPEMMPDVKVLVSKWIDEASKYLAEDTVRKLRDLLEAVPEITNMLHCDFHTNNVLMQSDEAILIDMDTLSHGHPIFELAIIFFTYVGFDEISPGNVKSFTGIDAETGKRFFDRFIRLYLETEDDERINEVCDKARLLSLVRIIRHVSRRGGSREIIDKCVPMIRELAERIDSLEF